MPIRFVPNDPRAVAHAPVRNQRPRADRTKGGCTFHGAVPEAVYPIGTPEFVFWQCREAVLAALEMIDEVDQDVFSRWQAPGKLRVTPDKGADLNAYYNRPPQVSFFHYPSSAPSAWSGASTDVVAHEVGHALLDAMRADLWSSMYPEVNAFHEAFGDCIAILTALSDRSQRVELLAKHPDLWAENFVESTAEDLSFAIKQIEGPQHSAAQPRHAYNWFAWALPGSLPDDAPPGVLSNEVHAYGQVFSGCFWDLIGLLFNNAATQTERTLWTAAKLAGRLLLGGVRGAVDVPRFWKSVGDAMIATDETELDGTNVSVIQQAFAGHGISLTPGGALAPVAMLESRGRAIKAGGRAADLAMRDLLASVVEPSTSATRAIDYASPQKMMVGATDTRVSNARVPVDLTGLSPRLKSVVAYASHPARVTRGATGFYEVVGGLPQPQIYQDETRVFVRGLVARDQIAFEGEPIAPGGGSAPVVRGGKTHVVVDRDGQKVLERAQFACRAIRGPHRHG